MNTFEGTKLFEALYGYLSILYIKRCRYNKAYVKHGVLLMARSLSVIFIYVKKMTNMVCVRLEP